MSKEDDNDKFLEIKEDSYDDLDNRYYSFGDNGMGNHDSFPVFDEPDDEIQDLSEMIATLFDDFVSLLPSDVQEYAEKAVSVLRAAGEDAYVLGEIVKGDGVILC